MDERKGRYLFIVALSIHPGPSPWGTLACSPVVRCSLFWFVFFCSVGRLDGVECVYFDAHCPVLFGCSVKKSVLSFFFCWLARPVISLVARRVFHHSRCIRYLFSISLCLSLSRLSPSLPISLCLSLSLSHSISSVPRARMVYRG